MYKEPIRVLASRYALAPTEEWLLRTPGHPQAMAELRQLIASTREEIGVALGEGRLDFAGRRLGEALNLFPQDSELRRQLEELSERRLAQTLFENTLALLQEGQFTDEEGLTAIQAYREVARLWPRHEGAENALLSMARYFADKARVSIEGEEVAHAMRYLGYATNADSEDEQVASVRQQIQSAQTMRQEVESLLESASQYLASGTLGRSSRGECGGKLRSRTCYGHRQLNRPTGTSTGDLGSD